MGILTIKYKQICQGNNIESPDWPELKTTPVDYLIAGLGPVKWDLNLRF